MVPQPPRIPQVSRKAANSAVCLVFFFFLPHSVDVNMYFPLIRITVKHPQMLMRTGHLPLHRGKNIRLKKGASAQIFHLLRV